MTPDALVEHIATLPRLPCGCTVGHEHLCPVAVALREAVGKAWIEYRNGRMPRAEYYAVGGRFLAHFENGRGQQEQEPRQEGLL